MQYHEDHPHIVGRNARYGLILFAVYVILYGGFVFLAVFRTSVMGAVMPGGANLAIAYGFALIGAALLLALVYVFLCGKMARPASHGTTDEAAASETESH